MKHFLAIVTIIGLISCFQTVNAQQASGEMIVGQITSKSEGALIGVSVKEIDGTNRIVSGTVTDINGDFSLKIRSPKNKLEITYLGYQTQTISLGDKKSFSIVLREDDKSLDEVVITAKKRVNTGVMNIPEREVSMAMQTIKADFENLSVASIDEALQGQIAGLDIIANSGDVGAGSAMRLRGTASINANVTPLIVVNDLIFEAENTDNFDFVNASNENFANLLSINVDDIESITVSKDGASNAIWGSRGANGVISIRTKRGMKGKPKLTYAYKLSQKRQPEGMKMLTGDEYTMFLKEAYFNPTFSENASNIKEISYIQNDGEFPDWRMYDNNTNWLDAVKTTGVTHDHYLTLSGGGDKATFYLSGGYYSEKGSIIEQGLDRYSARMDLNYYVSDRILFSSDMSFSYTDEEKNYEGLLGIAYKKMPNLGIYQEDANGNSTGEFYTIPQTISNQLNDQRDLKNPVAVAHLAENNVKGYRLNPTFRLQYDLIPYTEDQMLRIKALASFDIQNNSTYTYLPKELSSVAWTDVNLNKSDYGNNKKRSTTGRVEIQWVPKFQSKDHSLSLFARGEISGGNSKWQSEQSYGIPNGIQNPTTGSYPSSMGSGSNYWRGLNALASGHYSYKSKYNLDVSVRREGSSRFGPKRRFGTFWGASLRWNVIDEAFMASTQDWMSMFAFRYSMGVNGNPPGSDYLHFSRYGSWSSYLGNATTRPTSLRLEDLRWEKSSDFNIGADLGFFDDLFTASFNYYEKETSDLLHKDVSIPASSGYTTYTYQNVGKVKNEGWELHMNLNRFIKVGKFHADFNMNFANNRNTILEMDEIVLNKYNGEFNFDNGSYMTRLQLNNSFGSIYGFRYKGVYEYNKENWQKGTAPVAKDGSGNVILDSNGDPVPMYFAYGTTNQLEFQGGDAIYEDINHDGNINELDIVYLGNSNPKLNGGMGFKLTYGGLTLNVYSVFRYGNKIINEARMNAENMHNNNNQNRSVNWRWRKEGDQTDIPRALRNAGRNWLGSDRYVEDGSFWRINQLSLNYQLPKSFVSRMSMSNARVFLTVYNLYCFTNYSGVDPEVGYGSWNISTDKNQTPRSRSFTAGVSVNF